MSHKKLVRTVSSVLVGGTLFWMTGGSDAETYAHAKKITFLSLLTWRESDLVNLLNCINDSRGNSKYEFSFDNIFPPHYDNLPDFGETFNGPRAKFPASWDKSVRFTFN